MTAPVRIEFESRPLERIPCDLVVAGIFADDRPLRGGAARLDWRLCGLLSELVQTGCLVGAVGEAALLSSMGALCAPRALALGLGTRAHFPLVAARNAMQDAVARCLALGLGRVALSPLGIASDDLPRHAAELIDGVLEAARGASEALELIIALPGPQHRAAESALERAIRAVQPEPLSLRIASPPVARQSQYPGGRPSHPI